MLSVLARLDPEMETLQRDRSAPASLSLLHRPLALLGGGEVENSGESGVGLVGLMCGKVFRLTLQTTATPGSMSKLTISTTFLDCSRLFLHFSILVISGETL